MLWCRHLCLTAGGWLLQRPSTCRPPPVPCRRWLQDQLSEPVRQRCYFFNTFFFKKLTETSGVALLLLSRIRNCSAAAILDVGASGWLARQRQRSHSCPAASPLRQAASSPQSWRHGPKRRASQGPSCRCCTTTKRSRSGPRCAQGGGQSWGREQSRRSAERWGVGRESAAQQGLAMLLLALLSASVFQALPRPGFSLMQDVDLFAKDFIFVPVHDALHWSLMVVCHPGACLRVWPRARTDSCAASSR